MSTSVEKHAGSQGASNLRKLDREVVVSFLLLGLGFLPLMFEYFGNLWARPHYQFFVLLPIVAGWLAARDLRTAFPELDDASISGVLVAQRRGSTSILGMILLVVALCGLGGATYLRSPWLSYVAFLAAVPGVILCWGGIPLMRILFGSWVMLALGLSLPGNYDIRLISMLRDVTTERSSLLLDQLEVLHLVSGNVFELPEKPLFVADACTGIHSLFVLIAAAVMIGLFGRRGWLHIALLVLFTMVIVMLENVIRVAGIAYAVSRGIELDTGWRHEVFGVFLFLLSLGLVFSADQLVLFFNPLGKMLHYVVTFQWLNRRRRKARLATVADAPGQAQRDALVSGSSWRAVLLVAVPFAVLGGLQLGAMPTRAERLAQLMQEHPVDFPEFGLEALPADVNGWKLAGFRFEERIRDDPMGELSQVWVYEKNGIQFLLSLDYPFTRLHDLTSCYKGIGWQSTKRKILSDSETGVQYVAASFQRPQFGESRLFYTLCNTEGRTEVRFKDTLELDQVLVKRVDDGVPWFQIQLFASLKGIEVENLDADLKETFLELESILQALCLETLASK